MTANADPPALRYRDAVAAEATKIGTHPVTVLALAVSLGANLLIAGIDAAGVGFYVEGPDDPSSLSDFGAVLIAPVYAFLLLPVSAVASEYHGGQLRMSLSATPDRRIFVLAKLAATLLSVVLGALIAVAPARLVIGVANGAGAGELLADTGRWVAAYVFLSVVAFGIAAVSRSAIVPLGVMIATPVFVATGVLQWPEGLRLLPDQAALSLVGTPQFEVNEIPPGLAAVALLAWSIIAATAYAITVIRRDA